MIKKLLISAFIIAISQWSVHAQTSKPLGFTVNDCGDQLVFAPGNLQYQASTDTWRFAEHQWDYVGGVHNDNTNNTTYQIGNVYENGTQCNNLLISSTYDGWIDCFGWGTSGYNGHYPYMTSRQKADYATSLSDISGTPYDWGQNKIGTDPAGTWRTPTKDEWNYIFFSRKNAATLYKLATVNGVSGCIIFPDKYSQAIPTATTFNINEWDALEKLGAVFLPLADRRNMSTSGSQYMSIDAHYWSSTVSDINDHRAYAMWVNPTTNNLQINSNVYWNGYHVRLVKVVENDEVRHGEEKRSICEGGSYTWNGQTYTEANDYTIPLTTPNGCDSTATLHLTYYPTYDMPAEHFTIRQGQSITWNGTVYNTQCTDKKTLTTTHGCDSIVHLRLTVLPPKEYEYDVTICEGDTYTWNGETYSEPGPYTQTLTATDGSDSIVTIYLSIKPTYRDTIRRHGPDEDGYFTWEGTRYARAGFYQKIYKTAEGCDSILYALYDHFGINAELPTITQCADDPYLSIEYTATEKTPNGLEDVRIDSTVIIFTDNAKQAGFRDTTIIYTPREGNVLNIPIPQGTRAGTYYAKIYCYFLGYIRTQINIRDDEEFEDWKYPFELRYPTSVLCQNWDDFIGVLTHDYNGGYDFKAFQWYQNGQAMMGETHSYLKNVKKGYIYSVLLTEENGTELMSCEIQATEQTEISLYPTIIERQKALHLYSAKPATIRVYDTHGQLIEQYHTINEETTLIAPSNNGLYIYTITADDAQTTRRIKILVQ